MRKKSGRGEKGYGNARECNQEARQRDDQWVTNCATSRADRVDGSGSERRSSQDDKVNGRDNWVQGCKERGEWAELCFMARAAGLGMGVLKPHGDSSRFDVGVLSGGHIWRVQVKSTIYCRRRREYSLNVMGPGRKQYRRGTVDFFAVYLIPVNQWYIIPYDALGRRCTLHFTPGGKRQKYARYLEAWELLRQAGSPPCDERDSGLEPRAAG